MRANRFYFISIYIILLVLCSSIVLLSLVPPISRDALIHHLTIPKLYLLNGIFTPFPCMSYSYNPMNIDLIYMGALRFGSDIIPKFIHFIFGLMTAVIIHAHLKKRVGAIWSLLGALLFLSTPIIVKLSITVYVDLGLIFFSTLALMSLVNWVNSCFRILHLILSAIFCGLAMGTKYNGLIVFCLLTLFIPFIYSRFNAGMLHAAKKSITFGFIFAIISIAFFSPWMVRNYFLTHNPVYPLYNDYFNVQMTPPCSIEWKDISCRNTPADNLHLSNIAYRKYMYGEKWWMIALLPLRVFFQGKDNNFELFDGKLSILLLILPVLSFIPFGPYSDPLKHEKKIFAIFSVLYILFALFSSVIRMRYLGPAIPPLVILSVYGMKNISDVCANRFCRFYGKNLYFLIYLSVFLYFIKWHGGYLWEQFRYVKPISYITGQVSRDDYIQAYRHEYAAFQYINQHLPSNSKVMFFYLGKRGYYCNRKYFPDDGKNIKLLYKILCSANSSKKICRKFQEYGITTLIINNVLFKNRLEEDLSDQQKQLFYDFICNYTVKNFDSSGFSVYTLHSHN